MSLHIVLLEPEIPQNTGNIARTCAALNASLHLIRPLGFLLHDKYLKRAGLDYWDKLEVFLYDSNDDFLLKVDDESVFMFTTKAKSLYTERKYPETTYLLFGKESQGIPEELLIKYHTNTVRIPMVDDARSLNLANTAAIAAYEYCRQHQFSGLNRLGELHHLSWPDNL